MQRCGEPIQHCITIHNNIETERDNGQGEIYQIDRKVDIHIRRESERDRESQIVRAERNVTICRDRENERNVGIKRHVDSDRQ